MSRFAGAIVAIVVLCTSAAYAASPFETELRLIERDAAHAALLVETKPDEGRLFVQATLDGLRHRLEEVKGRGMPANPVTAKRMLNTGNRIAFLEESLRPSTQSSERVTAMASGGVSGRVTAASGGAPIAGAWVGLFDSSGVFRASVRTTVDGVYRFGSLNAGTYAIATQASNGYLDQTRQATVPWIGETTGVDFALEAGGRISGRVTISETGAPFSAFVDIYDMTGSLVTSVSTDGNGDYLTGKGLESGTYFAVVHNWNGLLDQIYNGIDCSPCVPANGTPIAVTKPNTTSGIDFALHHRGKISGQVTEAGTTNAVAFASIMIYDSTGLMVGSWYADAAGQFTIAPGSPATYFVLARPYHGYAAELYNEIPCESGCTITAGTPVVTTIGTTVAGVNFTLNNLVGRVRGTVTATATGAPLASIGVFMVRSNGGYGGSALTDSAGRYDIPIDTPGTYYGATQYATVHYNEIYDNIACETDNCWPVGGTPIAVTAGPSAGGIDFALDTKATISGHLSDAVTGAPLGVNYSTIAVLTANHIIIASGQVGPTGDYTVRVPSTGTYYVVAAYDDYATEAYDNVPCNSSPCDLSGATPIVVARSAVITGINFALTPEGRIAGRVRQSGSLVDIPVTVTVYDTTGSYVDSVSARGAYQSRPLTNGTYYVSTTSQGHLDELYDNLPCEGNCDVVAGTPVTVTAGTTTANIDFELTPLVGRIAGRITDTVTGQPIAGILVLFLNQSGDTVSSTTTQPDGTYIENEFRLTPGQYWIRTSNYGSFIGELYPDRSCFISCMPPDGQPVTVTAGNVTSGIDLALGKVGLRYVRQPFGSTAGGTAVTVNGAGFGSGTAVTFGGVPATVEIIDTQNLRAVTAAHAAGAVDVTVTDAAGVAATLPGAFRYEAPVRNLPYLVHDVNVITTGSYASSYPAGFAVANGVLYFLNRDDSHGVEMWKSDGTAAGTSLLLDITPGLNGTQLSTFYPYGPYLYFVVTSGPPDQAVLWRTDGTAAGTIALMTADATLASPAISPLAGHNGSLYFRAAQSSTGVELWRTDGSTAGTQLIKDINPGTGWSTPSAAIEFNGTLYFSAFEPSTGRELWKTDGTSTGTTLAAENIAGTDSLAIYAPIVFGNAMYFFGVTAVYDMGLFRWDGTSTPPSLLRVFPKRMDQGFGFTPEVTLFNGSLFFTAQTATEGIELWKTDGTAGGTVIVRDIGIGAASSMPQRLTLAGGYLLFFADGGSYGRELWRTDGTAAGTTLVKDVVPGSEGNSSYEIISHDGIAYFVVTPYSVYPASGALWKSDGTENGTVVVKGGPEPSSVKSITNYAGAVFFSAVDVSVHRNLWRTDGTPGGTVAVTDLDHSTGGTRTSYPNSFTRAGNKLFFVATDTTVPHLWVSDIESLQTVKVSDVATYPKYFVANEGTLYFTGIDAEHGRELWRSDGTAAGTQMVADLTPGPASSFFDYNFLPNFVSAGRFVYFTIGTTLYRTDGTPPGTFPVNTDIRSYAEMDGWLYYGVGNYPTIIYKTNGSAPGQSLFSYASAYGFFGCGGRLYFAATTNLTDPALWTLNPQGTIVKLLDFATGASYSPKPALIGDNMYFFIGSTLYRTDGTPAGTASVVDVPQHATSALQAAGGKLFFLGSDAVHGTELWVSDLTQAGTHLVKDIRQGPMGAFGYYYPDEIVWTNANGVLFFAADDGLRSWQLWRSDGTESGTYMYYDSDPSGSAAAAVQAASRLFFTGDGAEGMEPRAIDVGPVAAVSAIAPRSGPHTGGTAVTITGSNFTPWTNASLGVVPLRNVVHGGQTQISGTTPALMPGRLYDVVAANGESGTLPRAFLSDFLDVQQSHPFHGYIESIFRAGITGGCGNGNYCVSNSTTRDQMSIFLLRAIHGGDYVPPPATGTMFGDVPATAFAAAWIEELAREGITGGCGGGNFCPSAPVTRSQMAIFLLRTKHGSAYAPPPETGIFADVPIGSFAAAWIEQLYREAITGGCGSDPLRYCPTDPVTRGQMAVFLTRTVGLP